MATVLSVLGTSLIVSSVGTLRSLMPVCLLGLCVTLAKIAAAAPDADDFIYALKPGESVWSVGQYYLAEPRKWARLQEYNGVRKERQLPPGTRIRIPLLWLKQEAIAVEISNVTGRALWFAGGKQTGTPATRGQLLHSDDRLTTEMQSYVSLRLPEGSEVHVAPLSEITVKAQHFVGTHISHVSFKVAKGRIETQVVPRKHPASRYEIITPTAQLGVRGTDFRVSISENIKSSTTEVEGGVVQAANPTLKGGAAVDLQEGFATIVRAGQAPLTPIAMLPAPDLHSLAGLQLGGEIEHIFNAISGAIIYRIQLTQVSPVNAVIMERVATLPHLKFSKLVDGVYQLRVRAIDSQGIEGRDGKISFQVKGLEL